MRTCWFCGEILILLGCLITERKRSPLVNGTSSLLAVSLQVLSHAERMMVVERKEADKQTHTLRHDLLSTIILLSNTSVIHALNLHNF